MSSPYCYEYPRPAVTVDLAVFTLEGPALRVLLIQRKKEPFAGFWALPGGFLEIDEEIEAGARRELKEETGLAVAGPVAPIGVFGALGRDPRGRTISIAHATVIREPVPRVKGRDDASEAAWVDPRDPRPLAFDHSAILDSALAWLKDAVLHGPAGLGLLPAHFDHDDVKRLFRAIVAPVRSASAWRKRLERAGCIVPIRGRKERYRTARK
jgi:8-oxo-dGTP diphosphatase